MAFESLSDKLSAVFKRLRSKGRLTESDVKEVMREIKLALLEADVNFKVVKDFIKEISEKCVGSSVLESLTPAQQVIKIVNDELCALMGGGESKIKISSKPPTIVMLVGLQGAGKTTHCAKIANHFKKQGKRPLLVACDVYRPAAIKQLQVVGESVGIPVFILGDNVSPVEIAKKSIDHANKNGNDMVFLDTAGRLHIDEELMHELKNIKTAVEPTEILLTIDAMTGQDAVNVAENFNNLLDITGVILTKTDGDTRGGAALSVKKVTDKPIKFIGTGEKLNDIEVFHPDRMASRILGMGDILTLIEKAQVDYDEKQAIELEKKIRKNSFDLKDLLEQMKKMKNMGSMEQILSMMPGMNTAALKNTQIDDKQIARMEAIILSMTEDEQCNPGIINGSRKKRIANGSGTKVEDVNRLLKQFEQSKKLMKMFSGGGKGKHRGKFRMPF